MMAVAKTLPNCFLAGLCAHQVWVVDEPLLEVPVEVDMRFHELTDPCAGWTHLTWRFTLDGGIQDRVINDAISGVQRTISRWSPDVPRRLVRDLECRDQDSNTRA